MTETAEVMVNGRWPLRLPLHRAARDSWAWHEAARFAAMSSVIGPGDVVWDIGSEEGDHAALYAMWGAQVVLCEPAPKCWPNARLIFEANGLPDPVLCWDGFISDRTQGVVVVHLGVWPDAAYGDVVGDHGSLNLGDGEGIGTTTIDNLASRSHGAIPAPTVLTVDTEGSELYVLRGARTTLTEHRPHVFVSIHPEFMAARYGLRNGVQAIRWLMEECGYPNGGHVHLATDHEEHHWFRP